MELIQRMGEKANWYKAGRVALGKLSSPGRFTEELRALVDRGLVRESPPVDGETLPRLQLTNEGRRALIEANES